ncbi:Tail tape measure protein [Brevibacterium phage Rousseau]|nr:Tail tape measure protein [Brevibacterium phage Rousseau]
MSVEIATAWVSILPSTNKLAPQLSKSLNKTMPKVGKKAGQSMGSRMASAAGKALKAGAVVGVAAVGATVGAALVGGFNNAVNRQTSKKVLTGLYGDAKAATSVMGDLRKVAGDSPLNYESYLKAGESLAYAGVQGKDATGTLQNVGKAIVAAGGDSTKLDQAMGGVMKAVNNGGIAMMDSLSMISESGVPILSGLAEKFGEPIDVIKKMASKGEISIEDVMDVMQKGTGDTFQSMMKAGDQASLSFGNQWKIVKDNVVNAVGDNMIPLLDKLAPMMKPIGDAIVAGLGKLPAIVDGVVAAFKTWAPVLATIVAGLAAYKLVMLGITIGTAAYNAVLVAQKFATAGAAVQMRILNAAMMANPVGLIITAITLLVAGFILMYKKVGWFRDGVNAAWAGIKIAVEAVANWFKTVLWPTMQAVWDGIMVAVRAVVSWFQSYVAPVVKSVFAGVGAVFSWLWKSIVVPVFNGIKLVITTWWAGVKVIFNAVMNFIKAYLVPVFQLFWAIIKVVWAGIKAVINSVWQFIKKYVFTPIVNFVNNQLVPRFKFLQAVMKLVWVKIQYHIRTAWAFIEKYIFQPIVNWINVHLAPKFKWLKSVIATAWGNIKSNISRVWNFIRDKVFSPLKNAITKSVPDAFKKGKDAIGKAWDKVRDVAKKPVKFVVDTIINKGIIDNFNKIAKTFGVDEMPGVKLPKGFATGGYTGTGGKYAPAGVVHADEYVLRKEAQNKISRTHGRSFLDHMNRTGDVPGYAKGGKVKGNLIDAANWWIAKGARGSRHPAFGGAVRSGHSRGSMHYQDKAVDLNYGPGGENATEKSFFDKHVAQFKKLFTGIRVIWRAAGHFNHMHLDTSNGADMGDFSGAMSGGGGDISSFLNPFSGLIDKVKAGVGDSPFGKMIGEGAKKAISWPIDWLKSKAGMIGDVVENVKDVVTTGAGRARGKKWAVAQGWPLIGGARWKALDYIVSRESGWNPKAQNPSSTASGLGQFINSTSRAYMGGSPMKKYPFDDQLKGVIKYTDDRYGGLGPAMKFWKSHNYYAKGTKNASRGWATVGEQGPELIKLRGGEQIKSNRASQRFVDSNQDAAKPVFHVEFHGRVDDPNEVVSKLQFEMNRFYSGGRYVR